MTCRLCAAAYFDVLVSIAVYMSLVLSISLSQQRLARQRFNVIIDMLVH